MKKDAVDYINYLLEKVIANKIDDEVQYIREYNFADLIKEDIDLEYEEILLPSKLKSYIYKEIQCKGFSCSIVLNDKIEARGFSHCECELGLLIYMIANIVNKDDFKDCNEFFIILSSIDRKNGIMQFTIGMPDSTVILKFPLQVFNIFFLFNADVYNTLPPEQKEAVCNVPSCLVPYSDLITDGLFKV